MHLHVSIIYDVRLLPSNAIPMFSDGARCEVYENGGVERLARLLTAQLMAEPKSASSSQSLPRVACGFLFNLVNTHGESV